MAMDYTSMASGSAMGTYGIAEYLIGYLDQQNNTRPEYQIPKEISQNLSQAELMAFQGLPEESKKLMIDEWSRQQANALSQMGTRKAGLVGLSTLNQQGQDLTAKIAAQDAMARQQNQRLAMAQRQQMADYKDQQWQINKLNPYYERTAQNQALMGAGAQNVGNSFAVFGGSGSGGSSNPADNLGKQKNDNWDSYAGFGNNQNNAYYQGNTQTGMDMGYANQEFGGYV